MSVVGIAASAEEARACQEHIERRQKGDKRALALLVIVFLVAALLLV